MEPTYELEEGTVLEASISDEYNAPVAASDLPTRALSGVVVFEQDADSLFLRDLDMLDDPQPPTLDVVGRLTKLGDEGEPVEGEPGPIVRLTGVPEWSVEYDELTVVIWVSTAVADYKLLAPAAQYDAFWQVLRRKTALAARSIALLAENPGLTLKQLRGQIVKLNALAGVGIKLEANEFLMHADFVAEQIANAEGLSDCRALQTLREQLGKSAPPGAGAGGAAAAEAPGTDPNKRARKAPVSLLHELESEADGEKKKGGRSPKKIADPNAPKAAQSAFNYISHEVRAEMKAKAAAEGGEAASFAEVAKAAGERWQALGADSEERARYEAIANADHERFVLETRAYELEQLKEKARLAGKKRPSLGGGGRGLLACEREQGAKAKRQKTGEAEEPPAAAAAGTPNGNGNGAGAGTGAGADSPAAAEKSRRRQSVGEEDLDFPMEDGALLRRETAHRQMLVASGRSALDEELEPRYVYPPRGPAQDQLPPLPALPTPEALPLASLGVEGAADRLVMIWDFFNSMGFALKVRPLGLPIEALENALLCRSVLDYDMASQLHCALLRILIPDYDGVDGWDKWVKALRDPLLPLSWPRHLHMYLTVVVDLEESEAFDETYGGGDAAVREDITRSLAEGEWPELRPHLKLKLLAWLVERVQGSETVRAHLDRNAEASALLKRELQLQLDEEEELERQAADTRRTLASLKLKLVEAQAQQSKRSAGSGARGASSALQKHNAGIAEEQAALDGHLAELKGARTKRLDLQLDLTSMALRSDTLGQDRLKRDYVQAGSASGFSASPQLLVHDDAEGGGWGRLRGAPALRQLYHALHPEGVREGALKTALGRRPLRKLLELEPAALEKQAALAAEKVCKPHASKGLPPLYRNGAVVLAAAAAATPSATPAAGSSAADAAAAAASPSATATAAAVAAAASPSPAPPSAGPAAAAAVPLAEVLAGAAERLRAMHADVARRCEGLPVDPLDPADRPLLRAAAAGLEAAARPGALEGLRAVPPAAAAHFEQLRMAVLEFEERTSGAAQAWAEQATLQPSWLQWVRCAALPRELGAALLVLEANLAPSLRTRMWGIERSAEWRAEVLHSATMGDVVHRLSLLDECCNWDVLEKLLEKEAGARPAPARGRGGAGAAPPAPRVRRRVSVAEFARLKGERLAVLEWCDVAPDDRTVRARVHGELFALRPLMPDTAAGEGGSVGGAVATAWEWMSCGPALDQAAVIDLRGLTVGEAKGSYLTVWYEEEQDGKGKVDVPYVGVVIGVSLAQKGLTVRFDKVLLPDGSAEVMPVTNEDDWLWGVHQTKPGKGGRIRGDDAKPPVILRG